MLVLEIPERELFDEKSDKFVFIKKQTLKLEHSLLSLSKWESKWQKPFLNKQNKTREELMDYIRCMLISPVKENLSYILSPNDIEKITEYIESPMTATVVTFHNNYVGKQETITSELIYYWMIAAGIPFECEKWHLNRLFALIKICGAKSQPKQKGFDRKWAKNQAALNARRRAELKSKG